MFPLLLPALLGCAESSPVVRACVVPAAASESTTPSDNAVTGRNHELIRAFGHEVERGLPRFVTACRAHVAAFMKAEARTGVSRYWLAGIAAHESGGCVPRRHRAGYMHVMQPGTRHLATAQQLFGDEPLDWKRDVLHEAVLGGVMLRDYVARTDSLALGLRAYHVGLHGNLVGRRAIAYEQTVTIAAIMTSHAWLDRPYAERETHIDEGEIPPLSTPAPEATRTQR